MRSFPSWERGLKLKETNLPGELTPSFPSWERGLKRHEYDSYPRDPESFPSWERGLKLLRIYRRKLSLPVVPLVGTYIGTV